MKKLLFFTAFLLQVLSSFGQNLKPFISGDRVVFLGNSITCNGEFHHNVKLYYQTRYPQADVAFFNAGVSGDVTGGILRRIDADVMIHKPTHVVIMIGMNDVERGLYGPQATNNADTLARREAAITKYKTNLEKIVVILKEKGLQVALQKPSIYDQTGDLKAKNNLGVNDALHSCANFMGELSAKYQIPTVDYWSIMTQINEQIQKKDLKNTIVSGDRVHPASAGHLVMSFQFLKTSQVPSLVSKIEIKKSKTSAQNAQINDLVFEKRKVQFTANEMALPFPIVKSQKEAIDWVPFHGDLNQQTLKIRGLKKGQYNVLIDNEIVGSFDQIRLKKGLNLATLENTPQYKQALEVRKALERAWKNEENLRAIYWIEFNQMGDFTGDRANLEEIKSFLSNKYETKLKQSPYASFFKSQIDKYGTLKPNQNQYQQEMEQALAEAKKLAQTKPHSFLIQAQ